MAECDYCELMKKPENKVFEDNDTVVAMASNPAAKGHLIVMPKKHTPILEQAEKGMTGKLFVIANKMSALAFEVFQAQGTNIIVQNGVPAGQTTPHLGVHVLPRSKDDGLKLDWKPNQASDEELDNAERQLKEKVGVDEEPEEKKPEKEAKAEKIVADKDKDDYLVKQIERLP